MLHPYGNTNPHFTLNYPTESCRISSMSAYLTTGLFG